MNWRYCRSLFRHFYKYTVTKCSSVIGSFFLNSGLASLAGLDVDDILNRQNEDLAIADIVAVCGLTDAICYRFGILGDNDHLNLDLRDKVHDILGAPIDLDVIFLPPSIPLYLADGHAVDTLIVEGEYYSV